MDTFAKEFEGIENKTKEDLHDLQLDPDGKFKTVTKDKNKKICAINENKMEALQLNENGTFKSIICPICKKIPTEHRCRQEAIDGIVYEHRIICAQAFCAPCGFIWGCEGMLWRCKYHSSMNYTDV